MFFPANRLKYKFSYGWFRTMNKNDGTVPQRSTLLHATPSPNAVLPFLILYDWKVGGKERFGRAGTAVRDLMRGLSGAAEEHQHEEE